MEFEHTFDIARPREELWEVLMDAAEVAACIDGVRELRVLDPDHFEGTVEVRMGPVRLAFAGTVTVTARDRGTWTAALLAAARDAKAGGGFNAELTMRLAAPAPEASTVHLHLSTSLTGKLGQMGRPLVRKRVQGMLEDFATALTARETSAGGGHD